MLLRLRRPGVRLAPVLVLATLAAAHEATALAQTDTTVLVAYYSRSGNTRTMAEAVVEGARGVDGVRVVLKSIDEVTAEDLTGAQGVVLGSPTYFANMAGAMKSFIDDWGLRYRVSLIGKVGGAFATGGSRTGGRGHVIVSLLLAMLNNGMSVAGPVIDNRLGYPGASALAPAEGEAITDAELDEARALGRRVAELARQVTGP